MATISILTHLFLVLNLPEWQIIPRFWNSKETKTPPSLKNGVSYHTCPQTRSSSSTESDIFSGAPSATSGLPSLGTPTGNDFDSFGDSLNLTRLLAGDTASWDFNDPAGSGSGAAGAGGTTTQGSYRPWEVDLANAAASSAQASSASATSTYTSPSLGGPPNMLAPAPGGLPRPPHYGFQPHPARSNPGAPTYIDQRPGGLPSFQSQFQESVAHQAAFHPPPGTPGAAAAAPPGAPPHYTSLVAPHHAHAAAAAAAVHQQVRHLLCCSKKSIWIERSFLKVSCVLDLFLKPTEVSNRERRF